MDALRAEGADEEKKEEYIISTLRVDILSRATLSKAEEEYEHSY